MTRARRRALLVVAAAGAATAREARAADVELSPSEAGSFGAWLVAEGLDGAARGRAAGLDDPLGPGLDEATLTARDGAPLPLAARAGAAAASAPAWKIVVTRAPRAAARSGPHALAFGELHLAAPLHGAMLVGADGPVRAWIDGARVLDREARAPFGEDDEVVPLELAAGTHRVVFRLAPRGALQLSVRVVDAALAAPRGATLVLPGAAETRAAALVPALAALSVDPGLERDGVHASLRVSFPGGFPLGEPRAVRVSLEARGGAALASAELGDAPLDEGGAGDVTATLGAIGDDAALDRGVVARASVGGVPLPPVEIAASRALRDVLAAIDRALSRCDPARSPFLGDAAVVRATLERHRELVRGFARERPDAAAIASVAAEVHDIETDLSAGRDPLRAHAGIRRLAHRSALDLGLSPFALYVPPSYAPGARRTWPLVVALHGMNGSPVSMLTWFLASDDPARPAAWEELHPPEVPPIDAFVVAPHAFGNAMYRELGEVDAMEVVDWVARFFPIDPRRVTITGVSMGGTGAAWLPLRHPGRFAAAAPLCGYHSYFVRGDIAARGLAPWERPIAESRSNALWAENGAELPLYVWHGRRDLPVANSEVLVERYEKLGYQVRTERPDVGHDVWKLAYADGATWKWLADQRAPARSRRVVFRTDDLRWRTSGWLAVDALATPRRFGSVDATITSASSVRATTAGVAAWSIDRAAAGLAARGPVSVDVDGQRLRLDDGAMIALHRVGTRWSTGPLPRAEHAKRPGLAGPIRDVFHEPLTFVVGTADPSALRASWAVARHFARVRPGVDAAYPIVRDVDVDEAMARDRSLFLIGDARSNLVLRAIERELPFRIDGDAIVSRDGRAFRGAESGVAFVHPSPLAKDRYVVVVEGTSPLGLLRATSLPDVLPDFVVWDRGIAPARGSIVMGPAKPLLAGDFAEDWSLPPP